MGAPMEPLALSVFFSTRGTGDISLFLLRRFSPEKARLADETAKTFNQGPVTVFAREAPFLETSRVC